MRFQIRAVNSHRVALVSVARVKQALEPTHRVWKRRCIASPSRYVTNPRSKTAHPRRSTNNCQNARTDGGDWLVRTGSRAARAHGNWGFSPSHSLIQSAMHAEPAQVRKRFPTHPPTHFPTHVGTRLSSYVCTHARLHARTCARSHAGTYRLTQLLLLPVCLE